jgi:hypothetical protein
VPAAADVALGLAGQLEGLDFEVLGGEEVSHGSRHYLSVGMRRHYRPWA